MDFASDGASVMIGAENGVAAKLKKLVPELHSVIALRIGKLLRRVLL